MVVAKLQRASRYNFLMNTFWNTFLTGQSAQIENGRVLHFGDATMELQAAASGNTLADLSHLGLLQVSGEDAMTFLQGQVTNDIKLLNGGNSQYAGYCTAKGRLLAIFLAFAQDGLIHLQLNGILTEAILKRLRMYVLRSKVKLDNVSENIIRIGVSGPDTPGILSGLFSQVPAEPHHLATQENATLLRLPGPTPRYIVYTSPETAPALWAKLAQHGKPVGASCWDWLEIQAGIPDITPATQEQFVPQMVNLDLLGGISFKKGCYTGQEIVARTHYLGKVKRRTYLAHVASDAAPQPGNPVYGVGASEAVGQVVVSAAAPDGGYDLLAEIRQESLEGGPVRLSGAEGPPLALTPLPQGSE